MSEVDCFMIRVPAGCAPGSTLRIVGRMIIPPLAIAEVPATTCKGVTDMPWPKPTV